MYFFSVSLVASELTWFVCADLSWRTICNTVLITPMKWTRFQRSSPRLLKWRESWWITSRRLVTCQISVIACAQILLHWNGFQDWNICEKWNVDSEIFVGPVSLSIWENLENNSYHDSTSVLGVSQSFLLSVFIGLMLSWLLPTFAGSRSWREDRASCWQDWEPSFPGTEYFLSSSFYTRTWYSFEIISTVLVLTNTKKCV